MTDPDAVLGRIDDLLDGIDDDWHVSGDAMRWAPPEAECEAKEEISLPPDSFAADLQRLGEATREMGRTIAEQFAPITNAVNAAVELERRLDLLQAIVPDDTERAAYWTAAGGNLDRAIELAQAGEPPTTPAGPALEPAPMPLLRRLNIRIIHDRPTDARSTT